MNNTIIHNDEEVDLGKVKNITRRPNFIDMELEYNHGGGLRSEKLIRVDKNVDNVNYNKVNKYIKDNKVKVKDPFIDNPNIGSSEKLRRQKLMEVIENKAQEAKMRGIEQIDSNIELERKVDKLENDINEIKALLQNIQNS